MSDPFDLARFVDAQRGVFERACAELTAGAKRTHWMWFIFPQLAGLGTSPTARHYAIRSLEEATAYRADPVLGPRLVAATRAALASGLHDARALFGPPDDLKFASSLTLFERTLPEEPLFSQALDRFFDGERDTRTLALLGAA
ncbi:DUF1810 domain-containing protein [Acuticoccus mangrovi]|uniref:DUF1810 domain-containing protein n=1 Tax=Acuticoccus mangrovi TaxID=2796142 RepID=A0A934IR30_9HYPH|nr:DUF1810 domain-containing protein [Acuticoccus mangrovi]MBJ3776079.1 DUF1810 domain-containing protein [Acuticoccus mangrovi]